MFDKFGKMDYEELLRTAENEREEGDNEALVALVLENGLDREDAEDYIDGLTTYLCTPFMAASAKLELEEKELGLDGVLKDWKDRIVELCAESEGDGMSLAVRKKEKSLKECMACLLRFAFENKVRVPDRIVDITKVEHNGREEQMRKPLYLGIPSRADIKRIAKEYYLGGD